MIPLHLGFLPLTDCAVLVVAREHGFAAAEGLDLHLVRDTSWATARDRLVYRQVQGAQMLAPLAIAVTLGIGQHQASLSAPFSLSLNGSQIVVSADLSRRMRIAPAAALANPAAAATALAASLQARASPAVFGIVHRFSSHALLLRHWLAYAGIDPDRQVVLRVLPPSFMVEALANGELDGFCAGEPWGSIATDRGLGDSAAAAAAIWRRGVDKVLALRTDWMDANPDTVDRLLRALDAASAWCDAPANHADLADLLARPDYVDIPAPVILRGLSGNLLPSRQAPPAHIADFQLFHRGATNFPWLSQALWIHAQFRRWGFVDPSATPSAASAVFRPDLYRRALAPGTTPLPATDSKPEGSLAQPTAITTTRGTLLLGPDQFFDGAVFDPG